MEIKETLGMIGKIQQEGEKKIRVLAQNVIANHPNTIYSQEQHEENISRMIFLLDLYLNGNKKIQQEVKKRLEMWN